MDPSLDRLVQQARAAPTGLKLATAAAEPDAAVRIADAGAALRALKQQFMKLQTVDGALVALRGDDFRASLRDRTNIMAEHEDAEAQLTASKQQRAEVQAHVAKSVERLSRARASMLAKQHRLVEEVAQLQALTQRLSAAESQLREQAWCGESAAACEQALGDQTERLMALTQTKQQLQDSAEELEWALGPLRQRVAAERAVVAEREDAAVTARQQADAALAALSGEHASLDGLRELLCGIAGATVVSVAPSASSLLLRLHGPAVHEVRVTVEAVEGCQRISGVELMPADVSLHGMPAPTAAPGVVPSLPQQLAHLVAFVRHRLACKAAREREMEELRRSMLCVDDGNGAAFTLTLAEGAVLQLRLPADYPLGFEAATLASLEGFGGWRRQDIAAVKARGALAVARIICTPLTRSLQAAVTERVYPSATLLVEAVRRQLAALLEGREAGAAGP